MQIERANICATTVAAHRNFLHNQFTGEAKRCRCIQHGSIADNYAVKIIMQLTRGINGTAVGTGMHLISGWMHVSSVVSSFESRATDTISEHNRSGEFETKTRCNARKLRKQSKWIKQIINFIGNWTPFTVEVELEVWHRVLRQLISRGKWDEHVSGRVCQGSCEAIWATDEALFAEHMYCYYSAFVNKIGLPLGRTRLAAHSAYSSVFNEKYNLKYIIVGMGMWIIVAITLFVEIDSD